MECEKASSTAAFSRKLRNGHSHSFSFSGNAIYDGVFSSPAKKKSSALDYGEIFRGSGASIPFLEVPELNEKKIKVDVRRSKLDYSSVFGGFEKFDFAVSHEELISKPKKRSASSSQEWESKKTELHSNAASPIPRKVESSPAKNKVSSSEALHQSTRAEQLDMSYHQTNVNGGNGMVHIAQFQAVSNHTHTVDGLCPIQKAESNSSSVPSANHKPFKETLAEENCKKAGSESSDVHHSVASSKRSSKTDSEFQNIAGQNGYSVNDKLFQDVQETISNTDQSKMPLPPTLQKNLSDSKAGSDISLGRNPEFQNIGGQNGYSDSDKLFQDALETSDTNDYSKMPTPSVLQKNLNDSKAGSERSLGKNLGVPRSSPSEDTDAPGSPPYFDEESDVNSAAVASAAAAKKAIEEAQLSIRIAKEIMERKTEGFYSYRKQSFCDDGKATEKRRIRKDRGSIREKETQDLCEEAHISRQTSPIEAEEHARKARKLWQVPRGFSKSAVDHKQQEAEKCETMQSVDECARRPRRLWEIPGGSRKANVDHKVEEAEIHEGADNGINPRAEAQSVDESRWEAKAIAENTFFKLEQLGNKIKSVAAAFAGSKVDQKNDAVRGTRCSTTECSDSSNSPDEVLNQGSEKETSNASSLQQNQENVFVAPQLETCETKLTDIHEPTQTVRETEEDKHIDQLLQDPLLKQEKETESLEQDVIACESDKVPNRTETEMRSNEAAAHSEFNMSLEEVYEMVKFTEKYTEACEVGEDKEELRGSHSKGDGNNRCDEAQDFERVDIMLNDTSNSEVTDNATQQVGDSGLHENWNMLKQMFRQMFHTEDSKRDEEVCHLTGSGRMHLEVDQRAEEAENNVGTSKDESDTAYQRDETETVSPESEEPCIDNRVNEDLKLSLEVVYHEESDETAGETKAYSDNKLTKESLTAIEACNEEERMQFEACGSAQRVFTLHETKDLARRPTEILGIDQREMESSDSDTKSEKTPCDQNSESGHTVSENEHDEEELPFESELGDGGVEIADFEATYPEETSTASSVGEEVEELSQENGGNVEFRPTHHQVEDVNAQEQVEDVNAHKQVEDVNAHKQVEDVNAFMLFSEDNLSGHIEDAETDQSPCKPDEFEEPSEASDKLETSEGTEDNEDILKEEENFEPYPMADELHSSRNSEGSESRSLSEAGIELEETVSETRPENSSEKQSESLKKEGVTKVSPQKEGKTQNEYLKKIDEAKEREKEKEKERIMVERAIREARERAFADARERAEKAAMEKATKESRRRTTAEARGRSEKTSAEVNEKQSSVDKASMEARLRAERAAVERALAEARERALERALSEKARNQAEKSSSSTREKQYKGSDNSKSSGQSNAPNHNGNGEPAQRSKARFERNQRTMESAAKALAEKKMRDMIAQKEEAERNRLAETLDAEVKRWSNGKEGNLRALLSTLHYILGPESGWKPTPLTDLVPSAAVRKAYRRATLYVHPDKLQQRGAGTQQKYTCEKVFDLLKEAWNKFSADER